MDRVKFRLWSSYSQYIGDLWNLWTISAEIEWGHGILQPLPTKNRLVAHSISRGQKALTVDGKYLQSLSGAWHIASVANRESNGGSQHQWRTQSIEGISHALQE